MKFHKDGSRPKKNQIFVFGSNLAGRHGAGAALAARKYYGAVYGNGIGFQGRSYAIPTKGRRLGILTLDTIENHVNDFLVFARENREMEFLVTRVGCGLANYSNKDIATMFKGAPDNCSFAYEWQDYLE